MSQRTESKVDSTARSWVPPGIFHHVGFVVGSIENDVHSFAESLVAEWDGQIIHDPLQQVRVSFLRSKRSPADPLFELIEPVGKDSPVTTFLERRGGLHHICYLSENLDAELETCRARGSLVVRAPVPAAAFGGRRIAWVYTKNKLLIEYLER